MTSTTSHELFSRILKEKHSALILSSKQLLNELVGDSIERKKQSAQHTLDVATNLRGLLSQGDVPSWLSSLIDALNAFVANRWKPTDLIGNFLPLKASLEVHSWGFGTDSEPTFDFDAIFEHYKKQSKLPQLFDQLIGLLTDIESSGQVDSITMLNALKKVIATMTNGKNGSYFSLHAAWDFLREFLTNYAWAELSKTPILGTALEALEKTINATDVEMNSVHNNVKAELAKLVEAEIKGLRGKTNFDCLTYNKSPFSMTPVPNAGIANNGGLEAFSSTIPLIAKA